MRIIRAFALSLSPEAARLFPIIVLVRGYGLHCVEKCAVWLGVVVPDGQQELRALDAAVQELLVDAGAQSVVA